MMLGAQALRTKQKAEKREREKKARKKLKGLEQERENHLHKAAKRFGEAAHSALLDYSPSLPRQMARPAQSAREARTHSIYDFSASLGDRERNKQLKPRFSLNVHPLSNSAREPRPSTSFDRIQRLLLSPRASQDLFPANGRSRAGSAQSAASSNTRSSFSSAGTRLLKWLGLLSSSHQQGNGAKKAKRRMSAL